MTDDRDARIELLEETLRGILQEKQTALGSRFPSSRHELRKQIAWLESVLGGNP